MFKPLSEPAVGINTGRRQWLSTAQRQGDIASRTLLLQALQERRGRGDMGDRAPAELCRPKASVQ